jgi:hypothetical protein
MNKLNEKLSEVLDIEPYVKESNTEVVPVDSIEDDAEYARQNLRKLIDKGSIAADHIVEIAKQSEHPRAFEVAANMMKNLADMNKDLLEIQKRKKDLTGVAESKSNINVDKAVFVGSTTELVKFLKSSKE